MAVGHFSRTSAGSQALLFDDEDLAVGLADECSTRRGLPNLTLDHRSDGWWIVGAQCGDVGPYETRALAWDDRMGLLRFYRHGHLRSFVTCEGRKR